MSYRYPRRNNPVETPKAGATKHAERKGQRERERLDSWSRRRQGRGIEEVSETTEGGDT